MTLQLEKQPLGGDEEAILLLYEEEFGSSWPSYESSNDSNELLKGKARRKARRADNLVYGREKRRLRQQRRYGRTIIGGSYEPDNTLLSWRERRVRDGKAIVRLPEHDNTETAFDARAHYDRRTLFRLFGVIGIGGLIGAYAENVHDTTEREKLSHSYISPVYQSKSLHGRRHLLKVIAGFGNGDSEPTAENVEEFSRDHVVVANVLGRNGIDMDKLADNTAEYMDRDREDILSYAGFSMGGLMTLREAAILHDREDARPIDTIYLFCTPADDDVLRPEVRKQGYLAAKLISMIPGAEKSEIDRFIVEVFGARWREFIFPGWAGRGMTPPDIVGRFIKVAQYVLREKINSNIASSNRVAAGQFMMIGDTVRSVDTDGKIITASGCESSIKRLGDRKSPGDKPSTLIYVRPIDNEADQTVDNIASTARMQQYASDSKLPYIDIQIEGIGHADPGQHKKEYAFAISLARRAKEWLDHHPEPTSEKYVEEIRSSAGHGIVTIYPAAT